MPWLRPGLGKSQEQAEKEGVLSLFEGALSTHPPTVRLQGQASGAAEPPKDVH